MDDMGLVGGQHSTVVLVVAALIHSTQSCHGHGACLQKNDYGGYRMMRSLNLEADSRISKGSLRPN